MNKSQKREIYKIKITGLLSFCIDSVANNAIWQKCQVFVTPLADYCMLQKAIFVFYGNDKTCL